MAEVASLPSPSVPAPAAQAPAPPRLPIHQRHTTASRNQAMVDPSSEGAAAFKALLRREDPRPPPPLPRLAVGAPDYLRPRGESMWELVARKRTIFLAQMRLDTKHSEIAKLEQRTRQWDDALAASEAALEADSQRFEQYLKDNDAKLQEALRRADAEARARGDRAAEAKRLSAAIAAVHGDMAKIEEQLAECLRLKAFLDSVTPEEWFEAEAAKRESNREALRSAWQAQRDAIAARQAEAAATRQRAEHDMRCARTQQQFERAEHAHREATVALRQALAEQAPPEPECAVVDGEEVAMHFRDPAQLLAVFSQLEGSNMFQMQTAQDAEAGLEAARAEQAAATAALDAQAAELRRQAAQLEAGIVADRERCGRLQAAGQAGKEGRPGGDAAAGGGRRSSGGGQQQGPGLGELCAAVAAAHEAAGLAGESGAPPLHMLQQLEGRLEELLAEVGPPGGALAALAEGVERAREQERRQAARADKLAAQHAEQEARVARVLARAAAPRFQKSGKPGMARSVLRRRERSAGGERDQDAEEELRAFLALVDEAIPPRQ